MNNAYLCGVSHHRASWNNMDRQIRNSGLKLALSGALGVLFFWLTDPVYGIGHKKFDNPVDAMNEASLGTLAGVIGSAGILLLGLWIMTRRPT
jgi:hypothetical protein